MRIDFTRETIEQYKKRAEELGITLQEFLLMCILDELKDLSVTAYIANQ